MREDYICPNCEEDCMDRERLDEKRLSGINEYTFTCPHCKHEVTAILEMVPVWYLEGENKRGEGV